MSRYLTARTAPTLSAETGDDWGALQDVGEEQTKRKRPARMKGSEVI